MKCCNCAVEVSKEMKFCISANKCPACGKQILQSGNLSAFVPLCELISQNFTVSANQVSTDPVQMKEADIEALATLIISTFNVRLKSDKEEVPETTTIIDPKQKQVLDEKAALQKLRDEAYNESIAAQWGLTPAGEEPLDPDVGEALAGQMMPDMGPNAAQALIDQKREMARIKMLGGSGKVKRG